MAFGLKHFYTPTPLVWRKIGDAFLGISTALASYQALEGGNKYFVAATILTGAIGKYLTNFFTNDPAQAAVDAVVADQKKMASDMAKTSDSVISKEY